MSCAPWATTSTGSINRTLSATARRTERRGGWIHDDGERGREKTGLERRITPRLAVELHGPRRAFEHVDAYGAAAAEPQAPRAVRRPAHQLEERAQTLKHPFGPQHDHVQPAVVRCDVVA